MMRDSNTDVAKTLLVAFAAPVATMLGMYAGKKLIQKIEEISSEEEDDEDEEEEEEVEVEVEVKPTEISELPDFLKSTGLFKNMPLEGLVKFKDFIAEEIANHDKDLEKKEKSDAD